MAALDRREESAGTTPTIAVVNGGPEIVLMLNAVVEPGAYRIEFVGMGRRVYSRIRAMAPDLIVLCTRIDEPAGFQLLTMLKLDAVTRAIPVLTFTTECEGQEYVDSSTLPDEDDELSSASYAELRMN